MALETVVAYGTGRNAYIEGYRIGGKTGTAQKVKNGMYMAGNYILSFVGFLPADNPQAVVYVAIDNPKGVVQYGGTVAAPVAKNIMLDIIDELDLPTDPNALTKTYNWYDTKYVAIPNVIGMNIGDAKSMLKKLIVEYAGNGDIIKSISPSVGTYVAENSKIRILLGTDNDV